MRPATGLSSHKQDDAGEGFTPGTYEALGAEIGRLVQQKQEAYGDAFDRAGDVLRVLYPDGVRPEQYDDLLALTRIVDKCFRIANGNQGEENAWEDLAGYGLLGATRRRRGEISELGSVIEA